MKLKPRSSFLLLTVPCLALLALGFYFQRQPREFSLRVEKVEVTSADSEKSARGYDTKVVMWMRPQGEWPTSLQQLHFGPSFFRPAAPPIPPGQGPATGYSSGVWIYHRKNGKVVLFTWPRSAKLLCAGLRYDKNRDLFYVQHYLNLRAVPKVLGKLTGRVEVELYGVTYGTGTSTTSTFAKAHSSIVLRP